jgi:hypothetical protein
MFTRQAPPLLNNLWQSGMSPAQASAVGNLVGQCRQPLTHNGPVQIDYTRADMRLIGPADATFKYPGTLFPEPENFPREPSTPTPLPLPPRPGNPPRNPKKDPDPRTIPGKDNKPGGHFPPDHLPVEPDAPDGPGEEPQFPGQPWGPNAFNNLWFGGEYINVDLPNRRIGLENNDLRRHAVFPTQFNRKGRINSVEFVDKPGGNSPEFVRINIAERPFQTVFSVESAGLRPITYISDVDLSDQGIIRFERKTAWAFAPLEATPVIVPACCACECDCSTLAGTQPALEFFSSSCPGAFCPEPSPETCECPSVAGTLPFNGPASNNGGSTCLMAWEGEIPSCYTTNEDGSVTTAYMYVTAYCVGGGDWNVSVTVYKSFGVWGGQIFTGENSAPICTSAGKITGSVTVNISNGLGQSCDMDVTFNP